MRSVRRRLTVLLAAGFALVVAAAGLGTERLLGAQAVAEFDASLAARARALAALTEQENGRIELDYVPELMPEFEREQEPDHFQIWLDDGRTLLRSRRLAGDLPRAAGLAAGPIVRDAPLPGGRSGRTAQIAVVPRGTGERGDPSGGIDPATVDASSGRRALVLVLARGRERLDRGLRRMRLTIVATGGAAAAVALLLVWRAVAAGFRPIDSLSAQVARLDAESLGARIRLDGTPREIAPAVDQINSLLARLEASFGRERRFAANVAHELKTPIAELRSLGEVGASWPDDPRAVAGFFEDVKGIAGAMEALVTDLLLLARCGAGVEPVVRSPTVLRQAVAAAWSATAQAARSRGTRLRIEIPEGMTVETDAGKLAIILTNLLRNAVSHGREGSEVRCAASALGEAFELEISNPAAPLTPDELLRLAEPFWRKDEARSPGEHSGLGLSVVAALSTLLGLELRFAQDRDGTFRARISGRGAGRDESLSGSSGSPVSSIQGVPARGDVA